MFVIHNSMLAWIKEKQKDLYKKEQQKKLKELRANNETASFEDVI